MVTPFCLDFQPAPAGMTIDAFGRLEWSPLVGDIGSSSVEIIVTDGRGGEDRQNFALDVTTDQVAPRLQITLSDNPINLSEEVDAVVVAVDDVGVISTALFIGSTPVVLDATGRATLRLDVAGRYDLRRHRRGCGR